MTQRESALSRRIMTRLRLEEDFWGFKVVGNPAQMSGVPDIIACVGGKFVGLEVKHPETRKNVSAVQANVIGKINRAGGTALVVCSADEALEVIRAVRDKRIA